MFKTPILLIVFNRPHVAEQVIESIRKIKPKKLYIAADGARLYVDSELSMCEKTRDICINSIDWECEVKTLFRDNNLGYNLGPISAIKWFFEHEEMGIILEDVGVPDPSFFHFCEQLLHKYKSNKKVINITGGNLGYEGESTSDSYLFSRFMNTVGCATWRDKFREVDFSMHDWKRTPFKRIKVYKLLWNPYCFFDIDYYKKWYAIFNKSISSFHLNWWDYQFIFHQLNNKQYSIVPTKNLIMNTGYNHFGTHIESSEHPSTNFKLETIDFPLKHPKKIKPNYLFEEKYIKKICFNK